MAISAASWRDPPRPRARSASRIRSKIPIRVSDQMSKLARFRSSFFPACFPDSLRNSRIRALFVAGEHKDSRAQVNATIKILVG
jgi:hypothetical protein